MTTENNFRQITYSDSFIYDYKKMDSSSKKQNQLYIEIAQINNLEIETNNKFNKYNKIPKYVFKRLLMFMIHLGLISLFEIIFFFSIVSQYESESVLNLIGGFFKDQDEKCQSLNLTQKEIFTDIFTYFLNITYINSQSKKAYNIRKTYNYQLYLKSWYYFIGIMLINILLLFIKCYYKIKINLKKIFLDNLFMILILGIYEYLFLKTIILQYDTISGNEVSEFIVTKYSKCLN